MTYADCVDDLALLINTRAQADYLLYCLEMAARGIDIPVNVDSLQLMFLNERSYLHFMWQASEIIWPISIAQQQYLIA